MAPLPLAALLLAASPRPVEIPIDRELEVLPGIFTDQARRASFAKAGALFGKARLDLSGVDVSGARLVELSKMLPDEPFVRVVREALRIPIDVDDFILFLDDLLVAKRHKKRDPIAMPPGRGRRAGILIHPHEIFKDRPRLYAKDDDRLIISPAAPQKRLPAAKNREPLGPRWTTRYQQPETEEGRLASLAAANPAFSKRISLLITQFKVQGATVFLESTTRPRERGYLIFGSYLVSKASSRSALKKRIRTLNKLNRKWGLNVPIRWYHPRGWRATIEAGRKMAESYGVDYASLGGARKSNHYDGNAVDLIVVGLPRTVTLESPTGETKTFDLSNPDQPRDLSLTPEMIDWIEPRFMMDKLKGDYPHWNDDAPDAESDAG